MNVIYIMYFDIPYALYGNRNRKKKGESIKRNSTFGWVDLLRGAAMCTNWTAYGKLFRSALDKE